MRLLQTRRLSGYDRRVVRFVVCGVVLASLMMPPLAGAARPLPRGHYQLNFSSKPDQVEMDLHVSRERDRFVPLSDIGLQPCLLSVAAVELLSSDDHFAAHVRHPPVRITPTGFFAAHWLEEDGTDFRIQGRFVTGRIIRGTLSLHEHIGNKVCTDLVGVRFRAHWVRRFHWS